MAKYKVGVRTKKIIIASAKKMFYQNGYDDTSVRRICAVADVPESSITYHFRSKAAIAGILHAELFDKFEYIISRQFPELTKGKMFIAITNVIWWNLIFADKNIKRFFCEIYSQRIPHEHIVDLYIDMCTQMAEEYDRPYDSVYIKLIALSTLSIETELLLNIMDEKNKELMIVYTLESTFKFYELTDKELKEIYDEAYKIYSKLHFDMKYFENFSYNEKYLL